MNQMLLKAITDTDMSFEHQQRLDHLAKQLKHYLHAVEKHLFFIVLMDYHKAKLQSKWKSQSAWWKTYCCCPITLQKRYVDAGQEKCTNDE